MGDDDVRLRRPRTRLNCGDCGSRKQAIHYRAPVRLRDTMGKLVWREHDRSALLCPRCDLRPDPPTRRPQEWT